MKHRQLVVLMLFCSLLAVAAQAVAARPTQDIGGVNAANEVIWTFWDAEHYALLDDDDTLWIGTASGLVRLDKGSGVTTRISTADGLPHRRVFAAAVDGRGNRWFGGDGGLSKLDASGRWAHYNTSNSGLASDVVQAIAVSVDGDIWLGHGQQPRVSRLRADGVWMRYPNRETAISLAYEVIKQTTNENELWTVAGAEIWAGYSTFDGREWRDRQPEGSLDQPSKMAADSHDQVWALDYDAVYRWDGQRWSVYPYAPGFYGYLATLAVDPNDDVWVGGGESVNPYGGGSAAIGRLPAEPGPFSLDEPLAFRTAVSAMLFAEDRLWVTGANWLQHTYGLRRRFADVPYFDHVGRVFVDGHGTLWLYTHLGGAGALQTLDDRGTGTMADDSGEIVEEGITVTGLEVATNGDLWVAREIWSRVPMGLPPRRYYLDEPVDYAPPGELWPSLGPYIRDIFVEDANHTWFVYSAANGPDETTAVGIWSLDDGSTPADFADDVWTAFPTPGEGSEGVVAARDGRLWFGNETGVYLYGQAGWERLSAEPAYELIPAQNGVLFVHGQGDPLVIEAGGQQSRRAAEEIVLNETALVRSTTRRNQLWRVAPDGAVWYWDSYQRLARWDGQVLQTYEAPAYGGFIEVDENNHVWLAGEMGEPWEERDLWRLSPRPDFQLAAGPSTWFIRPNDRRAFLLLAVPSEGFAGPVHLALEGLPPGVGAAVVPDQVLPGETAVVSVTTGAVPLGESTFTITGSSGEITHSQTVRLAVVEQVHESWLPIALLMP